jgi:hypothetical protein
LGKDRFTPAFKFVVSKGAKEVVPISMIQGRKRNSINGELVIDPTDPSYREEVSPTTPADIYNHHNTVTVDPNQKQKDTINITDDPAATDNPSAWKGPTGTDDGAGFDLTTAGTTSIKTYNVSNTTNNSVFVPDDTKINVINLNKLIFVHNAFIYDENGHVVQEDGAYQIKTQGQKVKILDNGRVYKFNGQEYYKIDSGDPDHPYYVRTSSVGKAPKKQAVVMRGTLKSYYSKNGKIIGTWKKAK